MAKIPNTNTFSLQDVVDVINPSTDDLIQCFAESVDGFFDPLYVNNKDDLLEFRNYGYDEDSNNIFIINIITHPYFSGSSPPPDKENYIKIVYFTGSSYPVSQSENITKRIYEKSGDLLWIDKGATNNTFYRTTRPKVVQVASGIIPTTDSPKTLYFWLALSSYFKSVHPDVYYKSSGMCLDFELVAMSTNHPSLSINQSSLVFGKNKSPKTTNQIIVTASNDWYVICPDWITMDSYYGFNGGKTVVLTIEENNKQGDLEFYRTTNIAPEICEVTCYGVEADVSFEGNPITIEDTFSVLDQYDDLDINGLDSGFVIDIDVSLEAVISGSASARAYYRKNSGSWILLWNTNSSGSTNKTIENIVSTDIVEVRLYVILNGLGVSARLEANITGGEVVSVGDYGSVTGGGPPFVVYKFN